MNPGQGGQWPPVAPWVARAAAGALEYACASAPPTRGPKKVSPLPMQPLTIPRTRSEAAPRRGVALLTILLSLCAVALVAVVAIPAFFSQSQVTLDNACRLLLSDLRSAQNRSSFLKTQGVFTVHVDGWRATTEDGEPLLGHNISDGIVRNFSRDGVFEGVRIENIELGGDGRIAFDRQGLALEGGTLEVVFRDERRLVTIEKGTGLALVTTESGDIVAGDAFALNVSKP